MILFSDFDRNYFNDFNPITISQTNHIQFADKTEKWLNCQLNFDLVLDEFIGESKIAQGEAKAAQVESIIAQFLFFNFGSTKSVRVIKKFYN